MSEGLSTSNDPDDKKSEKKESSSKTKSSAETLALGAYAFGAKPTSGEGTQKSESLWQKSDDGGEKAESKKVESEAKPETAESADVLGVISVEETPYVNQELIKAKQTAESEQSPQPQSETEAAAAAAVERFREKIVIEAKAPEQAMDETLAEIVDEPASEAPETTPEAVEIAPAPTVEAPHEFTDQTVEIGRQAAEESPEDDATTTTAAAAGAGGSPPPPGSAATSTAGAAGPPPGPGYRLSPYATPGPRNKPETVYVTDNSELFGAAVVGGIIGYLIGRRRGRIKTEKRLAPIQKKLEKQVEKLRRDIDDKESTIRQAVAERLRQQHEPLAEAAPLKLGRERAVEATSVHGGLHPERIGQVVVTAEASPESNVEKAAVLSVDKHVETLSRADLLELSSKIIIEGSSLRETYETHLISEKGLRRLIAEHLRGGDLRRALRRELVEREIDFERDPLLRDRAHQSLTGGGSTALNNLLIKANVSTQHESDQELAMLKTRATNKLKQVAQRKRQRRLMDISLMTTIAVLLATIIMLAISRR